MICYSELWHAGRFCHPNIYSLVVGSSHENIFRDGFIKNFCSETAGLGEDYLYPDTGQDYMHHYFPAQILGIFEASPAQIPRLSIVCFCHRR